jgi:hypothetical protein
MSGLVLICYLSVLICYFKRINIFIISMLHPLNLRELIEQEGATRFFR